MKSYNDIKLGLLQYYEKFMSKQEKELKEAMERNDLAVANGIRKSINDTKLSFENIDEATKSYIGKKVNNILLDIEKMSNLNSGKYFAHFDNFADIFIGKTPDEAGITHNFGVELGLTKEDLSVFRGKVPSLSTTKDEFIAYANRHFGTNIPSCEDMMLMEEFKSKSNISRDEFVHYAEMYRDSGKISYPNGCLMTTVQDMIDDFDGIHKEQVSNKQM